MLHPSLTLATNGVTEERTGLWLRQTEHIRGRLWHIYSVSVNQVIMAIVKFSKWWLQTHHNVPAIFEIYKRGLWRAWSVALTKHAIHYSPRLGFPYYNMTNPSERDPPIRHPEKHWSALWVGALGTFTNAQ